MTDARKQAIALRVDWDLKDSWEEWNPLGRALRVWHWVAKTQVFTGGYIPTPAELWRAAQAAYGTGLVAPSMYLRLLFALRSLHCAD